MHEIEEGAKISVKTVDDEAWITGTFLSFDDSFGQDWLLLDIGRHAPRRINLGFVLQIEECKNGEVIAIEEKKRLRVMK